jgi:hypothetical protein
MPRPVPQEDLQMIAQSDLLLLRDAHHRRLARILVAPFEEVLTGHLDDDLLKAKLVEVGECGHLAATPAGQTEVNRQVALLMADQPRPQVPPARPRFTATRKLTAPERDRLLTPLARAAGVPLRRYLHRLGEAGQVKLADGRLLQLDGTAAYLLGEVTP